MLKGNLNVEILEKNIIIICIDGCRLDRALDSKTFMDPLPGSTFFSQSITYAPYTNSSVHALISGTYGNRNGCNSYWHSYQFRNKQFKTLTEYLHENNFHTQADVHSDLIIPENGFDEYEVFDESKVDLTVRHKQLLENMKKKEKFFLYLHYSTMHTNIMNSVLKPYNNFSEEYFKNIKNNNDKYNLFFKESENYLKQIIKHMNELDLIKDSIIIIFSDHGTSVGERIGERAYGAFCYDYTIKSFVNYISSELPNQKIDQQIRHVDVMPSILEHLGIEMDQKFSKIDGISFLPLIRGEEMKETMAYTETANPLRESKPPKIPNTRSIRTSNWKLIFNEYNDTKELYNLKEDPDEKENLIDTGLEIQKQLWDEIIKIHNKL